MVKAEHRLPLMAFLAVAGAAVVILGIGLTTPALRVVVQRPAVAAPATTGQAPDMVLSRTFQEITPLRTAARPEKRTVAVPTPSEPQAAAPALAPVTTVTTVVRTSGATASAGTSTAPRSTSAPRRHRASTKPVLPVQPAAGTNTRATPQAPVAAPDRPRGPGASAGRGHGAPGAPGASAKPVKIHGKGAGKVAAPLAAPTQLAPTSHVAPGRAKKDAAPARGPEKAHGAGKGQDKGQDKGQGKAKGQGGGPGPHGRASHHGR